MKDYTQEEIAFMLKARQEGKTAEEIGKTLNRTTKAIERKLQKLTHQRPKEEKTAIIKSLLRGEDLQEVCKKHNASKEAIAYYLEEYHIPPSQRRELLQKQKCKTCGKYIPVNKKLGGYCSHKCAIAI